MYARDIQLRATEDPRQRRLVIRFGEAVPRHSDVVGLELAAPLPEGLSRVALLVGDQTVLDWRVDGAPPLRLLAGADLLAGALTPARLRPGLASYMHFALLFEYDEAWIRARDGGFMRPVVRRVAEYSNDWDDFFDGETVRSGRRVTYRSERTGDEERVCPPVTVTTPEVRMRFAPAETERGELEDGFIQRLALDPRRDAETIAELREPFDLLEVAPGVYHARNRLRYASNMAGMRYALR